MKYLLTLVIGGSVQHPKDFQDVTITVVSTKFVARTIKAEYELASLFGAV